MHEHVIDADENSIAAWKKMSKILGFYILYFSYYSAALTTVCC